MKKQTLWLITLACSLLTLTLGLTLQWPHMAVRLAGAVVLVAAPCEIYHTVRAIKKR